MALIYWRGQAGTGNGDIGQPSNWASSPTTSLRLSSIGTTDDAVFTAGAYPEGARINLNGNRRFRSVWSDESSPTTTFHLSGTNSGGIQLAAAGSSAASKFSSKISFEGSATRGVLLMLYEGTVVSFEGSEENYKGLDYLTTYNNGVGIKSSINNPTALRNLRLSVGGGPLDLFNSFTHFKSLQISQATGGLQNLRNNTLIVDPTHVIEGQLYYVITGTTNGNYSNLNVVLSNNQISSRSQIFKTTSKTIELASLTLLNVNELEVEGALEVSGKLQIDKINKLSISNGGSVRANGTFESTAVGTQLVSVGTSANFAVGPARSGAHTGAIEVDEWKINNVQSDSRNITTVAGTLTGNTTGFAYREGGAPPVIETRAITSTINPIAFGIVKTTEELTREVRYTVEPIKFSAIAEGVKVKLETIEVNPQVNPINFTVAAEGSKVLIEDRTITSTINPIEFSVTSIPMKQQIEERLVEIIVSPIMASATARELKIKTGKRAVNIQSSPIKFSATGKGMRVKSEKYTITSTIGEIFLSVETIGRKVQNESREIISYVSPIRMKVTSYPLGVVKKYVAQVTVIDTEQPHFIYVAKNEPAIHVAKSEPTIKLI